MEATRNKRENLSQILNASFISVLLSIILILIFALVIKLVNIDVTLVPIINLVIKAVSIFIGVSIAIKSKGLINGAVAGLIYTVISMVILLLLGGEFEINSILIDLAVSVVIGALAGIMKARRLNR